MLFYLLLCDYYVNIYLYAGTPVSVTLVFVYPTHIITATTPPINFGTVTHVIYPIKIRAVRFVRMFVMPVT